MNTVPRTIIFDMDGVIIDSEPLHERAQRIVFVRNGLDVPSDALGGFKGQTEEDVFDYVVDAFGNASHDRQSLISEKHAVYEELIDEMVMIDGALDFIGLLSATGHRLALTTSAIRANQRRAFERFGLANFFEVVVTAEDVTHPKPHPQPYRVTASRMGVPPENCLVIEDSINGIRSARDAGCSVAAITTSFAADALRAAGAHVVGDSFPELRTSLGIG